MIALINSKYLRLVDLIDASFLLPDTLGAVDYLRISETMKIINAAYSEDDFENCMRRALVNLNVIDAVELKRQFSHVAEKFSVQRLNAFGDTIEGIKETRQQILLHAFLIYASCKSLCIRELKMMPKPSLGMSC